MGRGLLGRVGELDAAGLHPAAGQHLGLDHDRAADLLGGLAGLVGGRAEAVLGDGDPRQLDDLACLELVEPHAARNPIRRRGSVRSCRRRVGILPRGESSPPERAKIDASPVRCSAAVALARRCAACRQPVAGKPSIDDVQDRGHDPERAWKSRFMKRSDASTAPPIRRSRPGATVHLHGEFRRRQAGNCDLEDPQQGRRRRASSASNRRNRERRMSDLTTAPAR